MLSKSVVIALSDSPRLEGFQKSNWGVEFSVFDAVDTRDGHIPKDFNIEVYRLRSLRDPHPGEMGCAVSHYRVIKEFAEEVGEDEDLMLVAEDDARPVKGFHIMLEEILQSSQSKEIVLLSEPIFGSLKNLKYYAMSLLSEKIGSDRKMGHYADKIAGTGLYLISRGASKKFVSQVEKAKGVSWAADDYNTDLTGTSFVSPYQVIDLKVVRPGLADWEGESTIHEPEGYEKFKQRKLEEHSTSHSGLKSLMVKAKSKISLTNIILAKNLFIISAKDLRGLLLSRWAR
ncbi:glycosyltransferase family 25 protein [Rothia nasimurium]|uniref:glycosyltransferase family 25 protein n=1 Tax=Rothia nasimurium TaxID=85336 RepID=UPI001F15E96C|nr:glycosyltransferase family 25 protein [Rothia nasimurium]